MEYSVNNQICKTYRFKFPIEKIPFQAIVENSKLLMEFFKENEYAIKSLIVKNDYNVAYGIAEFEVKKDWVLEINEDNVKEELKNILKEYFNLPSLTFKSFNVDYKEKIPSLSYFNLEAKEDEKISEKKLKI